jgi:hypothetical protein
LANAGTSQISELLGFTRIFRSLVAGRRDGQTVAAALQSPPTRGAPIDPLLQADLLQLLDYAIDDLLKIPPAKIHGGADPREASLRTPQQAQPLQCLRGACAT